METASKTRHAKPAQRVKPSQFAPSAPVNRDHQANISSILRSTGAQAKLTIGQPNDKYEQEADRVSDQVMRMSDADVAQRVETGTVQPMRIQRMCEGCEEEMAQRQPSEEEDQLQAKEMPGQTPQVSSSLESRINSLKTGGQPLDPVTRAFFEPRFGHDFSNVRVHNSGQAADVSRSINAKAFTQGNNIAFDSGQYQPQSSEGRCLLGHELTHVMQQGGTPTARTKVQRTIGDGHDLQSSRFTGDATLEAVFDGERYIRNGSRGAYVRKIQQALVDLGHNLPRFGVDGVFGSETDAVVRRYQTSKTFQVDGIVGPETMGGLDRAFIGGGGGGATPVTPTPVTFSATAYSATGSGNANISESATGLTVRSPTVRASGTVSVTGDNTEARKWDVGFIQTVYSPYTIDASWQRTLQTTRKSALPLRDAIAGTAAPWYYTSSFSAVTGSGTSVSESMNDTPWATRPWNDPRVANPNSLEKLERNFSAIKWIIARRRTDGHIKYLKHSSWGFNFIVDVDMSQPVGSRGSNSGTGLNTIVISNGKGASTPKLSGTISNNANVETHVARPPWL